jgi:Rrf2 family protein
MPERFLLQILRGLVTRGILHSTRGVDGGYYLARPASQITLRDIIEAFDNPIEPRLPEVNGYSSQLRELVVDVLKQASEAARFELEKVSLDDLLNADFDVRRRGVKTTAGRGD